LTRRLLGFLFGPIGFLAGVVNSLTQNYSFVIIHYCLSIYSQPKQHKRKRVVIIKFSRHAKRRGKLYQIPEITIAQILQALSLEDGEHEIIQNISGFKFPIKVVAVVKKGIVTVITNYPLKKGREK
jgi:ABC-type enterochelin transport system ATPase subunit